jgi:lysophospholipase L1-like esterase
MALANRGMIILGVIILILSAALVLFYDSPIGWDEYHYMGLVAGVGWLLGGLVLRRRILIILLYGVCAAAAVLALIPFMQMGMFYLDPYAGDLYSAVHNRVADEQLTWRIKPNAWGHDKNGFRNARVPAQADIIAIGDSQTWGINARRGETWPSVLADLSGQRVYSMALGGYGPVEYGVLMREALAQFSPQIVIVAFYFGNDLYDTYQSVYLRDTFAQFRDPGIPGDLHLAAQWRADGHYDGGAISTEFTSAHRLTALDLDHPEIAEGLRLAQQMLEDIHQQARAANVQLIVLLIPTKESAYASLVTDPAAGYQRLIEMEKRARADLIAFLDANQMGYLDSLPALEAALRDGQAVFPSDKDGHLNPRGYALIAAEVYKYFRPYQMN